MVCAIRAMQSLRTQFNSGNPGFTLVELLVVIAIISVMASLGSGLFTGTLDRLKLDRTANSLLLAAKYARTMAVEQQRRYRLCLDERNQGFFLVTTVYDEQSGEIADVVVTDHYCKPVTFEGGIEFEKIDIISAGDMEAAYEDLPTVVFRPDGTAETAVIQIGNGRTSYTVSVNAAIGKVKLIAGTAENIDITSSTIDLDAR